MKAVVLQDLGGPSSLKLVERPDPAPGPGQVLVRLRAAALNYRDTLVTTGGYGSRQKKSDLIPLSDGAGEVAAVGPGVTRFAPGDRVTVSFFQSWVGGEPTQALLDDDLGRAHDGTLCELGLFKETGLVHTPDALSDVEAASTPCAGLTAWTGIVTLGATRPGDTVLVQGTGGVSLFALQFAKLAGAEVVATSSSDQKLERVRTLGADHLINYVDDPDWGKTALNLTGGRGVDHVMEVGGAGTMKQSLRAIRPGGMISLVGVLAGARSDLLIPLIGSRNIRLQGVTVGTVEGLATMLRAMALHGTKPVIDEVFDMKDAQAAYEHLIAGRHFGKVCIAIP